MKARECRANSDAFDGYGWRYYPTRMPLDTLAERMRAAREARGLGSSQLALSVGGSHSLVSEVERGKSKSLQADTAIKLARALSVPVEWLVLGEGPSPFAPTPKPKTAIAKRKPAR